MSSLDDDQALELGQNLVNGVPIATPVFDGAREHDIVEMLEAADLDTSGQVILHDGVPASSSTARSPSASSTS